MQKYSTIMKYLKTYESTNTKGTEELCTILCHIIIADVKLAGYIERNNFLEIGIKHGYKPAVIFKYDYDDVAEFITKKIMNNKLYYCESDGNKIEWSIDKIKILYLEYNNDTILLYPNFNSLEIQDYILSDSLPQDINDNIIKFLDDNIIIHQELVEKFNIKHLINAKNTGLL